ncbi:MAG: NAD(P)-dependent glycerol-3-phosphate dehydrogenase [Alphaproteobacteria bacterium]|nr:NAD(P)-dependent glycerol-3-phosphate dehydrogenase [Alphaproteobacteria bacterium]MDD9920067.1 NAD(P)-dependent glycerol-3-phosphate dehydrogenase [Alphaproteobacteria bacterium]
MSQTIGVLGANAAGTAFAQVLALSGHNVLLWDTDKELLSSIDKHHENKKAFPGILLSQNIKSEESLVNLVKKSKTLFITLPTNTQTEVATQIANHLDSQHILVQTATGLRQSDGALLTTVWQEIVSKEIPQIILAGPNFALEMMEEHFTAFILASTNNTAKETVAKLFTVPFIRPYYSDDPIGAQIGGALRNVLAIAAGVVDGLELGINARAAVLCRGLKEMQLLGQALGAHPQTMTGLSGMGDIILHTTSKLSRNYRFGLIIGKGKNITAATEEVGAIEGVTTARMVAYLAATHGLDLAIISAVDGLLNEDITPTQVYEMLTARPIQEEFTT